MIRLATVPEVRTLVAEWRRASLRVALVPTMGALHGGHLSLVREAKRRASRVAVSIFVNPLQFGPNEDLARYPRDLEGDVAKCSAAGADAVFHPEPPELYPPGFDTSVEVARLAKGLCGERRPGHFRGVATVVTKLLVLFSPDVAVFGRKDYQQLKIVERLALDLGLPTEIVGAPIVREPDGLAMSSRNAYLSPEERRGAPCLREGLLAARRLFAAGERDVEKLREAILIPLTANGARMDYVELRDRDTLLPERTARATTIALVAAFIGRTRLIDNEILGGEMRVG